MHLFSAANRFFGGNAIVGGGLPLAVGLALADRMRGRTASRCASSARARWPRGEFHESVNLAVLRQLPVLFLCENNLYAMGTALQRSESQTNLSVKAAAYEMPAWSVDGMDVDAVAEAAGRAVAGIRAGGGPVFVEARTYRFRGHSLFDADQYRDPAEIEEWKGRDPIDAALARLPDADRAAIEREVDEVIEDAVAFAEDSDLEDVAELTRFVYSEGGAS